MTVKTYLPPGIDTAPTTPAQALACARAVIEEEGRWAKSEWYRHHAPDMPEYKDDPYCNGWETCAAGALLLVTIGMTNDPPKFPCGSECGKCNAPWRIPDDMPGEFAKDMPDGPRLYYDALRFLGDAVSAVNGDNDAWNIVPRFNDRSATTREDIIGVFRDAETRALAAEAKAVPA